VFITLSISFPDFTTVFLLWYSYIIMILYLFISRPSGTS